MHRKTLSLSVATALTVIASGITGCLLKKATLAIPAPSPSPSASPSPAPINAEVFKVSLSATGTPTSQLCFPITATGIGSSGIAVSSDQDVIFTLSSTIGSGTFYSDLNCTTATTTATLPKGSSTVTIYYKDPTPESVQLKATYNAIAGTSWSATLYGPVITSIQLAHTVHTDCAPFSLYFADSHSSTMVESATDPTTVTLTQTSGAVTGSFFASAGCSGSPLGSAGVTPVSILAGSTNSTIYFRTGGNGGAYTFNASWSCTTASSGVVSGASGYTIGFTY